MPLGGKDARGGARRVRAQQEIPARRGRARVNMKFAPDLRFRLDERFDEAERIDKLLRSPPSKRDLEGDDDE